MNSKQDQQTSSYRSPVFGAANSTLAIAGAAVFMLAFIAFGINHFSDPAYASVDTKSEGTTKNNSNHHHHNHNGNGKDGLKMKPETKNDVGEGELIAAKKVGSAIIGRGRTREGRDALLFAAKHDEYFVPEIERSAIAFVNHPSNNTAMILENASDIGKNRAKTTKVQKGVDVNTKINQTQLQRDLLVSGRKKVDVAFLAKSIMNNNDGGQAYYSGVLNDGTDLTNKRLAAIEKGLSGKAPNANVSIILKRLGTFKSNSDGNGGEVWQSKRTRWDVHDPHFSKGGDGYIVRGYNERFRLNSNTPESHQILGQQNSQRRIYRQAPAAQ